jgi:hypothetical protein
MDLADGLTKIREGARDRLPPGVFEGFQQATAELVARGIEERALAVGDEAPDFELPGATGKRVRLSRLLERGPVIASFYRGPW